MEQLLNDLKELALHYRKLANYLEFDGKKENYPNSDTAINDGKSKIYRIAYNDLNDLLTKYNKHN